MANDTIYMPNWLIFMWSKIGRKDCLWALIATLEHTNGNKNRRLPTDEEIAERVSGCTHRPCDMKKVAKLKSQLIEMGLIEIHPDGTWRYPLDEEDLPPEDED